MELINATKMKAAYTMGTEPSGRNWLVVAVKATFGIPDIPDQEPTLSDEQIPLVVTDAFTGEPGFSAPLHEVDFALRKPKCDVLLNGSAYAPGGQPTERLTVALQVGLLKKSFDVVGKRVWEIGMLGPRPGRPEPFTVMPISYDNAFGGVDKSQEDVAKHRWYTGNPVGIGYHEYTMLPKYIDGKPLTNTEETNNKITNPKGSYCPMAFGPLGRSWEQRIKFAGTYDQKWLDDQFPFLPTDFQDQYYQAAPADQQIDYPQGGEEVVLSNLTAQSHTQFKLPKLKIPIAYVRRSGEKHFDYPVLDTIVIEPNERRFMLVWRSSFAIRKTVREMKQVAVGSLPRQMGKRRFESLAELIAASKGTKQGNGV